MSRPGTNKMGNKTVNEGMMKVWPPSPPPSAHRCPPPSKPVHPLAREMALTVCLSLSGPLSPGLCFPPSFSFFFYLLGFSHSLVSISLTSSPSYQACSEAWGICLQQRQQQGSTGP